MENEKICKIVQDLLPNYIENLTSEETNIIEGLALPHLGGGIAPDYGLCFWCDRQRQRGRPLCI